jgi:hypothetical protein
MSAASGHVSMRNVNVSVGLLRGTPCFAYSVLDAVLGVGDNLQLKKGHMVCPSAGAACLYSRACTLGRDKGGVFELETTCNEEWGRKEGERAHGVVAGVVCS